MSAPRPVEEAGGAVAVEGALGEPQLLLDVPVVVRQGEDLDGAAVEHLQADPLAVEFGGEAAEDVHDLGVGAVHRAGGVQAQDDVPFVLLWPGAAAFGRPGGGHRRGDQKHHPGRGQDPEPDPVLPEGRLILRQGGEPVAVGDGAASGFPGAGPPDAEEPGCGGGQHGGGQDPP
ncbi:hypothetical protein [Arthrobacter sp. UYCu712]|uniref:hypothetical protein n=1 Tax=Arthrobacter sp. UYCu712 TaxID=3156340 RepID=UPI00339436DD